MKNFCISMTSIPPRFDGLEKTLNSLETQNKKTEKIFLNIPEKFNRFTPLEYDFNTLLKKFKKLKINKCEDYGPGTKLIGSLDDIMKYDYVVLVDDDHVYKKEMLEIFYEQANKNLEASYSFCVYDILDCKIGQGADGFLINTKYLKNIMSFFNKYVKNNKRLIFNDDLWISIYLNKILNTDIKSVFHFLNKPFFIKNKSIYKKHTQISALIETYSSNRKIARELKYKENCKEYLLLKNSTNNFTNL